MVLAILESHCTLVVVKADDSVTFHGNSGSYARKKESLCR